jgi:hypothetical protein
MMYRELEFDSRNNKRREGACAAESGGSEAWTGRRSRVPGLELEPFTMEHLPPSLSIERARPTHVSLTEDTASLVRTHAVLSKENHAFLFACAPLLHSSI